VDSDFLTPDRLHQGVTFAVGLGSAFGAAVMILAAEKLGYVHIVIFYTKL
jgi:hypothetical protein